MPWTSSETMTAMGTSRLAFLASPPIEVTGFESDQDEDGDCGLNERPTHIVNSNHGGAAGVVRKLPFSSFSG